MEKNRLNAIMLAILAACIVIMIGKGCSSGMSGGKDSSEPVVTQPASMPEDNFSLQGQPGYYAEPGTVPPGYEGDAAPTEPPAEPDYITVTDLLGRVEGTIPITAATDETGAVISGTETTAADVPEDTTEPTRSLLDEYSEQIEAAQNYEQGGFYHPDQGSGGQLSSNDYQNATFPDDFTLYVG
ncbi:MAG: hypothetical protein IJ874_02835 [Ruminococcus sp.]|nr:hypothetical protein [Ruminococcus sp.]